MAYPVLNATSIEGILRYANSVSDHYLGVAIMLVIYFVALFYLLMRGEFTLDSMTVAGWIGIISGSLIYLLGILTNAQFFILVASFATPLVFVWLSRDKE